MKIKWRKWNRVIHRDFGYFFAGMTIIYALSGIALNHIRDWNPNYVIQIREIQLDKSYDREELTKPVVLEILAEHDITGNYKKHYFPEEDLLKIFIDGGSLYINLRSGKGLLESISRRPLFYHVNFLHYNPIRWWTWFSDIFCIALIFITITGLLVIRGKNGITGRGWWMTALGLIIPLTFLVILL
ncbi:MAG: PepSY-associated TM helix domain-containing protein [Bacteroidales bacterium]|nr:MAG: PepSY-associated TM helix domain-containing protein [Bacteroidales bacterium]